MASPSSSGAALPDWVMLDRHVFRRDDPRQFREDERTSVASSTSTGAPFRVSFVLAEPPAPSRLYLRWPDGPKLERTSHLVAAHRHLVLLRLDSPILVTSEKNPRPCKLVCHDYYVYIPNPPSQTTPVLRWLPAATRYNAHLGKRILRPFEDYCVGLLCRGEDEFALAYLTLGRTRSTVDAQLWVLRSSVRAPSGDDATDGGCEEWVTLDLPIRHKPDEFNDIFYWETEEVIPFENSLCWVNYYRGILFCDDVFGDSPKVSYHRLPLDSFPRHPSSHVTRIYMYRRLCVTEGGGRMVFVEVTRDDGQVLGRMAPSTGFTITSYELKRTEDAATQWLTYSIVTSVELWDKNTTARLPHQVMVLPLLSMDKPDVVHLALYEWQRIVDKVSLLTIDLSSKQVVSKVIPYINGEEDLSTEDADMVKMKRSLITDFLPSEFPKFLNPHR
ncbi:hypothetical protein ACP4OV_008236 [Aristida adscensionis]